MSLRQWLGSSSLWTSAEQAIAARPLISIAHDPHTSSRQLEIVGDWRRHLSAPVHRVFGDIHQSGDDIHARSSAEIEFFPAWFLLRRRLTLDDEANSLIGHRAPLLMTRA